MYLNSEFRTLAQLEMLEASNSKKLLQNTSREEPLVGVGIGVICLLAFLVFNPFLALLFTSFLSLRLSIPSISVIVPGALSFGLFFYSRQYGIDWYPGSTDDIPQYIELYQSNIGLDFVDLFTRFAYEPTGNEPLWHGLWWAVAILFSADNEAFLLLHYLVLFLALFIGLNFLSRRYLASYALVYFLLIPISLDFIAHIWRQSLAGFIILIGLALYLKRGKIVGKWLVYLSPLIHLSSLFFVFSFAAFEVMKRREFFDDKKRFVLFIIGALVLLRLMSFPLAVLLDAFEIPRVLDYFVGERTDNVRVVLLLFVYALPQMLVFVYLKNDDINYLLLVFCFTTFALVITLPEASAIYERMLMFTLPLLSLFLYRSLVANYPHYWIGPVLLLVFVIGCMRIYFVSQSGYGPGYYLAFGHAFDPTMGLIKLLVNL